MKAKESRRLFWIAVVLFLGSALFNAWNWQVSHEAGYLWLGLFQAVAAVVVWAVALKAPQR